MQLFMLPMFKIETVVFIIIDLVRPILFSAQGL